MGCTNSVAVEKVPPKSQKIEAQSMRTFLDEAQFNALTFKFIASDPVSQEYFMRFLATEHAKENLEFFQEVEAMKKGFACRHDMLTRGLELAEKFLVINAPNEVNVSDRMKKNIIDTVHSEHTPQKEQELMRHLEKAQNEVLIILSMGSFPRFLKSKLYEEYYRKNGSTKMKAHIEKQMSSIPITSQKSLEISPATGTNTSAPSSPTKSPGANFKTNSVAPAERVS